MRTMTHVKRHAEINRLINLTIAAMIERQRASDLMASYVAEATTIPGITKKNFVTLCKTVYETPGDVQARIEAASDLLHLLLAPSDDLDHPELELN